MLKGRTTIQLRNAKTGELEQEVTEENLVTNAVQNILSMPYFARMSCAEADDGFERGLLSGSLPIYPNAYGGISIFKNAHEESVDKIFPDSNNELIGYAGGVGTTESAEDLRCGELNTTESKELENGYHFVWDFDTEKANGTFKSVSLGLRTNYKYTQVTNYTVGESVNKNFTLNYESGTYVNFNNIQLSQFRVYYPALPSDTPTARLGKIVKMEETTDKQFVDVYAVFAAGSDSTLKICIEKIRLRMPHVRSITQKEIFTEVKRDTLLGWTTPPNCMVGYSSAGWARSLFLNIFIDEDKINLIYFNTRGTWTNFTHTIYGLDGKQISTTDVVAPEAVACESSPSSENIMPAIYRNGYYYSKSKNGIIRFNKQGVLKDTISETNSSLSYIYFSFTEAGYLAVTFGTSSLRRTYYIQIDDDGMRTLQNSARLSLSYYVSHNISSVKKPWVLRCSNGLSKESSNNKNYMHFVLGIDPYYLGTINNLEKSITKTDAQTMKIIYDLTEEAEE